MEERRISSDESALQIGGRIREARRERQMSQLTLSRLVKIGRSAVAQWERGESLPSLTKIEEIARVFELTPSHLAFGVGEDDDIASRIAELVQIPEWHFLSKTREGVAGAFWTVSSSWLRNALGLDQADGLAFHRCVQSTSSYEMGDYLIIDREDQQPSPPGEYLYWDGHGARVGQLSFHPLRVSDGALRIRIADDMGAIEMPRNELQIAGRIRGFFRAVR